MLSWRRRSCTSAPQAALLQVQPKPAIFLDNSVGGGSTCDLLLNPNILSSSVAAIYAKRKSDLSQPLPPAKTARYEIREDDNIETVTAPKASSYKRKKDAPRFFPPVSQALAAKFGVPQHGGTVDKYGKIFVRNEKGKATPWSTMPEAYNQPSSSSNSTYIPFIVPNPNVPNPIIIEGAAQMDIDTPPIGLPSLGGSFDPGQGNHTTQLENVSLQSGSITSEEYDRLKAEAANVTPKGVDNQTPSISRPSFAKVIKRKAQSQLYKAY